VVIVCRPWLLREGELNGPASMAARLGRGEIPAWLSPAGEGAGEGGDAGDETGDFLILRAEG
jgi:hypothetical protein